MRREEKKTLLCEECSYSPSLVSSESVLREMLVFFSPSSRFCRQLKQRIVEVDQGPMTCHISHMICALSAGQCANVADFVALNFCTDAAPAAASVQPSCPFMFVRGKYSLHPSMVTALLLLLRFWSEDVRKDLLQRLKHHRNVKTPLPDCCLGLQRSFLSNYDCRKTLQLFAHGPR